MIIITTSSTSEAALMRAVIASHLHRLGDEAPEALRDVAFAVIGGHLRALGDTSIAADVDVAHDALMSYRQAAQLAGCSARTIGRRASDGTLVRVGRRVTTASVLAMIEGARS